MPPKKYRNEAARSAARKKQNREAQRRFRENKRKAKVGTISSIATQFDDTMAGSQEDQDSRVAVQVLLERVKKDVTSIVQFTQTHRDPTFERHLAEQWDDIQAIVHQSHSSPRRCMAKEVEERANALGPELSLDLRLEDESASTPSSSPDGLLGQLGAMHETLRRLREETRLELRILGLRNAYSGGSGTALFRTLGGEQNWDLYGVVL